MNIYCHDCGKYIGLMSLLPVCHGVIEGYCVPCYEKLYAEESLVNNDADLEAKFRDLIKQLQ